MLCNVCHQTVVGTCVTTVCRHLYCVACAEGTFSSLRRPCRCGRVLSDADVRRTELFAATDPRVELLLAGLEPDAVLACARSGIAFWEQQALIRQQALETKVLAVQRQAKDDAAGREARRARSRERDSAARDADSRAGAQKVLHLQAQLSEARRTIASLTQAAQQGGGGGGRRAAAEHEHEQRAQRRQQQQQQPQRVSARKLQAVSSSSRVFDPSSHAADANPFLTPPATEDQLEPDTLPFQLDTVTMVGID